MRRDIRSERDANVPLDFGSASHFDKGQHCVRHRQQTDRLRKLRPAFFGRRGARGQASDTGFDPSRDLKGVVCIAASRRATIANTGRKHAARSLAPHCQRTGGETNT